MKHKHYNKYYTYDNPDVIKLEKGLEKMWLKMAKGNLIIITKDKYYYYNKTFTSKSYNNDWKLFDEDNNVEAILYSSMSYDTFEQWINWIVYKYKGNISSLVKNNLESYVIDNYKKFFHADKITSQKDYCTNYKEI